MIPIREIFVDEDVLALAWGRFLGQARLGPKFLRNRREQDTPYNQSCNERFHKHTHFITKQTQKNRSLGQENGKDSQRKLDQPLPTSRYGARRSPRRTPWGKALIHKA